MGSSSDDTPQVHKHVEWSRRYLVGDTPWDRGRAHGELSNRIASGQLAPPFEGARVYVPGCGRGHDALALARAGWQVTATDIVEDIAPLLAEPLAALGGYFEAGDSLVPPAGDFDLVWEHTFLCALRPDQRAAWAGMVRSALRPGGRLAVLVFPADKPASEGGPPWGYDVGRLLEWLGDDLRLLEEAVVDPCLEARNWAQAFALFEKR